MDADRALIVRGLRITTEAQRHRGFTEKRLSERPVHFLNVFSVHPPCLCASVANRLVNSAPNPAAGAAQQAQPTAPVDQKPARVRIVQRDSSKILMLESQDGKIGNAVIHRSYIAK